ncbi:hypothetical protein DS742_27515 [Lacrimispora amygdalina]|uniref:DNA and RNA helicase n=1 Tax=Lacrimispora amygdalina TaxID=253257 RepID=A0A3E2N428_9FIRM|nr:hypothetical protein [Clostridium indicum]RFZ75725.1 hypothetical protein DS742_27515 [Clostridium indicum]
MQNLYPLFERNRILKKELLWSLRDYSFAHIQLEYQEYDQGILRGYEIKVRENDLVIGPGIFKYGNFVCLQTEEERVPYTPKEQLQYLRMKVEVDRTSQDYIAYKMEYYLSTDEKKEENEFELCRFHLRSGARLRDQYRDFGDMETEYDTVSLIHSEWGGLGGKTLSPAIVKYFARNVLESENSQSEDRSFAYLCLTKPGAVPIYVIASYISNRSGTPLDTEVNNQFIYRSMCGIIEEIQKGGEKSTSSRKERHRILVD